MSKETREIFRQQYQIFIEAFQEDHKKITKLLNNIVANNKLLTKEDSLLDKSKLLTCKTKTGEQRKKTFRHWSYWNFKNGIRKHIYYLETTTYPRIDIKVTEFNFGLELSPKLIHLVLVAINKDKIVRKVKPNITQQFICNIE